MKGGELIKALREKLDKDNNAQLAEHLGISGTHPRNLENQEKDLAPHQITSIVEKAMKSAVARKEKEIRETFIKPIAEYCPIPMQEGKSTKTFLPGVKKDTNSTKGSIYESIWKNQQPPTVFL